MLNPGARVSIFLDPYADCELTETLGTDEKQRKKRRREYYAKNAERIREQSRMKMAEKRAAVKAKRRKSDGPQNLAKAELAVAKTLTEMLEGKVVRTAAPSPQHQAQPEDDLGRDSDSQGGGPGLIYVSAHRGQQHTRSHDDRPTIIREDPEVLAHQHSIFFLPRQREQLEGQSPTPEPEGPMPSFYDKLWAVVEKHH
ncbi:hypothetical protein B0H19DRAFT_1060139 [Mycena capillaripes]|nr:hypothetical protein B0H19DRAFT_1060139 [Mycena capillaripes]